MEALNIQLLRIFDWLLWTTIQGSVLVVLIVLLQVIFRRRLPVRWHYLLWVLLLIRLAVPWLPESKMSIFNLVPRSVQQGRIIESFSQSRRADSMDSYMYGRFASATQKTDEPETASVRFMLALPVLWLVGTVMIAGYIFFRSIRLWRIVKRERPVTDSEILDRLEDCKMQMGVQTILGVVVSDRIKSPALFGFVRPRLLLPQGMFETFSHEELRYVFIHELAHLKQRDIYFGWLIALLHILHWFNPLMWFAFGRIRADREMACDTLAISMMGPDEPSKYGRTIVSLLESFSQACYLPSVAGILEDTCQMERRIKMIADYKKTSHTRWAGALLLLAVLACVVLTNAYVAKADFTFGTPTNLGPNINTSAGEVAPNMSADGLSLYFTSENGYGGRGDIWVAHRTTTDGEWGSASNLGPVVNSSACEASPCISADGLTLFFCDGHWGVAVPQRPGGYGDVDLWCTTRLTQDGEWNPPVNLGPLVNSPYWDGHPAISGDGLSLYFDSDRPGGHGGADIYVVTRASVHDEWGSPVNLGPPVNSSYSDNGPGISGDGRILVFTSLRPPVLGLFDIWMAERRTQHDPWETPIHLDPPISSSDMEGWPRISPDNSTLYFSALRRSGGFGYFDLWQAPIIPIVDFNDDGNIDTDDLVILVNCWGTNERLCDIGPTPLGDGIVDMEDLKVFMSYWEQENMPEVP